MRGLTTFLTCGLFAATAMVAAPERAQAVGGGPRIDATAQGYWWFDSGNLNVTGVIVRGFLRGTFYGSLLANGSDDEFNPVYAGRLFVSTRHGTLYLDTTDLVAVGNGSRVEELVAHATVAGGDGSLDGATGAIYLHGIGDEFGVLAFDEISGTINLNGQ